MDDFQIDGRKWCFLDSPKRYIEHGTGELDAVPLKRQFKTATDILGRLSDGRGVLLADDVGLGKTTVAALVAWIVACQGKSVRIYAPNEVMRRRWAKELERHVPMLQRLGDTYVGISNKNIRQGAVKRLRDGSIQVATHHALVKSRGKNKAQTCDLMIIDEAHRAKGQHSQFSAALKKLKKKKSAKRTLILTATPFSIQIAELLRLLDFVGGKNLDAVSDYAEDLKRLYTLGDGHDAQEESERLQRKAQAAIATLGDYVIRHSVDDLSPAERKHFGSVEDKTWKISTPPASSEDIKLLLRMDRLLQLAPARPGERRNDPRFHIGWGHVDTELHRLKLRSKKCIDPGLNGHIGVAENSLRVRRAQPHPKIAATSAAIPPLLGEGEKVLVFCHHRAVAAELLKGLEISLKVEGTTDGPSAAVWRDAWEKVLAAENIWEREEDRPSGHNTLIKPVIDWLCSPGLRRQVGGWLGAAAPNSMDLARQIEVTRPRHVGEPVQTIAKCATELVKSLLDPQSKSTRALLRNMAKRKSSFGGGRSHFPGRLDEGFRVMGAWDHDVDSTVPTAGKKKSPKTLYTGKPDVVLALFNSPFGPDVLVATDRLSEGVDLHRFCRHLIHYELDPSPVRTLQRNGRVRRIGSWAALTGRLIRYAYPTFDGTRDEVAADIMRRRVEAFGVLLGGVPVLDEDADDQSENFADAVLKRVRKELGKLNGKLRAREYRRT